MRLTDIMSAMHLGTYAEVGLVLFMAAFCAITVNAFRRGNARAWERARHLPLDVEDLAADPHTSREATTVTARRPQE